MGLNFDKSMENPCNRDWKRALEVPPIPKGNGCRFHDYKLFGVKVAVGKVIFMMNFSPLSHTAWSNITRGAVSYEQHCCSEGLCCRVSYPNGLSVSINKNSFSYGGEFVDLWVVVVLYKNRLYPDKDGFDFVGCGVTEKGVVAACDKIRSLRH